MPAGPIVAPEKAKLNFLSTTNLLAANAANFKMSLHTSTWAPNDATNEVLADATNEIAAGNGYAAGGIALTGVTLALSGGAVKFTCSAPVWTATGGSIPAWRRGVIYYNGTLNGKVNPIVGHFLGDNTPADIPATTVGNTLTVTPNAAGLITVS